jgi:RIO-like serine/threonine protein kinase
MKIEQRDNNKNVFCGIDISKLQVLGEGRQGRVYLLPENKVIKVYKNRNSCINQLLLLQHAENSRYFPKVYFYDDNSIIMELINGIPLNKYLKSYKLNKKIALGLVELINEFKQLGFVRLDIRISHIFIQEDESIRIIDPRGCFKIYQPYPYLMLRGLREYGMLGDFFEFIKNEYPEIYIEWKSMWSAAMG